MKKILDTNIEWGACSVNKNMRIEIASPKSMGNKVLSKDFSF